MKGSAPSVAVGVRARRALGAALRSEVPEAEVDDRGYVHDVADNFLEGITRDSIAAEFEAGAGSELETKMRAPWSSAMLAVNSFGPWRNDLERLVVAGTGSFAGRLQFEAKCDNGVSRIPPHLDVLLERGGEIVGIESKCTEYLSRKKRKVSPKYLALTDARVHSKWFEVLAEVPTFRHLDAYQLVKHYLGLRRTFEDRPLTLVYLYWEPLNADSFKAFGDHRYELARFAALVKDDPTCRFVPLSYERHWDELSALAAPPGWLGEHLARLRRRYLVALG